MRNMFSDPKRRERPVGKTVDAFEIRNEKNCFLGLCEQKDLVGKTCDVNEPCNEKNVF